MTPDGSDAIVSRRSVKKRVKTGCWTCRARRVKCDERKPLCIQCENKRLECNGLGYHGGIQTSRLSVQQAISGSRIPLTPANLPQFNSSADICDIMYLIPVATSVMRVDIDPNPLATIIRAQGITLQLYLEHLPAAVGYDRALDSASKCVAAALRETSRGIIGSRSQSSDGVVQTHRQETLSLYMDALKQLQVGLEDPKRSLSVEILCATALLTYFEALYGHAGGGIVSHANGASKLIQHRGTKRFSTQFESALLASQFPMVIMLSMFQTSRLFLNSRYWMSILKSCTKSVHASKQLNSITLEYMLVVMPFVDILATTTELVLNQDHKDIQRIDLLHQVDIVKANFKKWKSQFTREAEYELMISKDYGIHENMDHEFYHNNNDVKFNMWLYGQASWLLLTRLDIALGCDNALQKEREAQRVAQRLMSAQCHGYDSPIWPVAFHTIQISARGIVSTGKEWESVATSNTREVVDAGVYCGWLRAVGMTVNLPRKGNS